MRPGRTAAGELVWAALLCLYLAADGCERITGVRPPAKPCISDTTFWIPVVTATGRLDSLEAHQRIDACGGKR